MDVVRYGLAFVATVALMAAAAWWKRRRARRQAVSLAEGHTVRVPAKLRGGAPPYPKTFRRGALVIGDGVNWAHRFGGDIPLLLDVTRVAAGKQGICVAAVDAQGERVELEIEEERADMAVTALRASPTRSIGAATYREGWKQNVLLWPMVMLALAFLWSAVWGFLWFGGETVRATVISNEDDTCDVSWIEGTRTESSEVDCNNEEPGDVVSVRVLGPPLQGEALDLNLSPIVFVAGGIALALVGIGGVAARLVRQTLTPGLERVERRGAMNVKPDELIASNLTHAEVARVAKRRGALEGWAEDGVTTSDWSSGRVTAFFSSWRFMVLVGGGVAAIAWWDPVGSPLILLATGACVTVPSVWRRRQDRVTMGEAPRGASFVILPGHDGEPVFLLYRATDVTPWAGAELRRPAPMGIPVAGDCRIYQGPRVVLEVANQVVRVDALVEIDDLDFVRGLVNADFLESVREQAD